MAHTLRDSNVYLLLFEDDDVRDSLISRPVDIISTSLELGSTKTSYLLVTVHCTGPTDVLLHGYGILISGRYINTLAWEGAFWITHESMLT